MRMHMKRVRFAVVLGMGLPLLAGSAEITKEEKKTFSLSPDGSISLTVDQGNVTIRSRDGEGIELTMTKTAWGRNKKEAEERMDALDVSFQQSGNRLFIREQDTEAGEEHVNLFDIINHDGRRGRAAVDFDFLIPKTIRCKVSADEGNIDVFGLNGDLDAQTDEGNVLLDKTASERVNVVCDEGHIRMKDLKCKGLVRAEADEGRIQIENAEIASLDISLDEGNVLLDGIQSDRMTVVSDEGNISAAIDPSPAGRYKIESDEGDIRVSIPKQADLSVILETAEGGIDSDFRLHVQHREEGRKMDGDIGKGGAFLKVYSGEGDIVLDAKTASGR